MPPLEYIAFSAWIEEQENENFTWQPDQLVPKVPQLPQIFWSNGEGWAEANHWAIAKIMDHGAHHTTVAALMKHLSAYATFLETKGIDWRHFPLRIADRAIVRFRGNLLEQVHAGRLAGSTARARMSAVIQFYRHALANEFISPASPIWQERTVVLPYYDATGFKRTVSRVTTNLSIPNRSRPGATLEDGLLPLSEQHMMDLLRFTDSEALRELHLMLKFSFFTGARLGSILSLRISNIESARPDPSLAGFVLLAAGPGTGIQTKFDVRGELLVPDFIISELRQYFYSVRRLTRESRTAASEKNLVFLTSRGRGYSGATVSRLMTDARRLALRSGLTFMQRFKFHQARATYGTWLMKLSLAVTDAGPALAFVKSAMLHKKESTTFTYIRFLESTKGKQQAASAFNKAFTSLANRNWNEINA